MLSNEIINSAIDYLQNRINKDKFIYLCKRFYEQMLGDMEYSIRLDSIIIMPFIHEFAYCRHAELELKEQVTFLCGVLNGTKSYHYSSFFKVIAPEVSNKIMYDLYRAFPNLELSDLKDLFTSRIHIPLTLTDILYNLLYDILSKLDWENPVESEFDYVNCCENISYSKIREKIFTFMSYYLGLEMFYVDITIGPNGKTICMIS